MSLINNKKVAAYIRLSVDDPILGTSLENQLEIITNYCNQNKLLIKKVYSDNGYTGSNFDRPAFKEMMKDIEVGLVDTVVVKDLSRFGRNLIKAGEYIDEYFITHQIRFISINDDFDNAFKTEADESIVLKMFLNDYYVKECRKKGIDKFTIIQNKRRFKTAGIYGYKVQDGNLIIDDETAPIVRQIFNEYLKGNSCAKIAKILNEQKTPTPYAIKKKRGGYVNVKETPTSYLWTAGNVNTIIANIEYTGIAVNYKTYVKPNVRKNSLVDRKLITLENDHEPIISKELFDKVAALRKSNTCQNKKKITVQGITERLDKFLYCPVCGHSFVFNRSRYTLAYRDKKCGINIKADIAHKALYERCLDILSRVKENPEDFKKLVLQKQMPKTYQESLKEITLEKQEAEVSLEKLFEEYALGDITKEDYDIQAQILNDELETVELKQNDLMKEKYNEEKQKNNATKFLLDIQNLNIEKLTKVEVIKQIIDKAYLTRDNEGIVFTSIEYKF